MSKQILKSKKRTAKTRTKKASNLDVRRRENSEYEFRTLVVEIPFHERCLLRVSSLVKGKSKRAKLTMHKQEATKIVPASIKAELDIHDLDQLIRGLLDARSQIVEAMQRERGAA